MTVAKPKFASDTTVAVETSRTEIQKLLEKHGVTGFGYAYNEGREMLTFEIEGRRIRFEFAPFRREDFRLDGRKRGRTELQIRAAMDQAHRTRWRELLLGIKAKLVLVAAGVTTLEEEFLAHVVLANGQTMHQWARPYIAQSYLSGNMPPLLPGLRPDDEGDSR